MREQEVRRYLTLAQVRSDPRRLNGFDEQNPEVVQLKPAEVVLAHVHHKYTHSTHHIPTPVLGCAQDCAVLPGTTHPRYRVFVSLIFSLPLLYGTNSFTSCLKLRPLTKYTSSTHSTRVTVFLHCCVMLNVKISATVKFVGIVVNIVL